MATRSCRQRLLPSSTQYQQCGTSIWLPLAPLLTMALLFPIWLCQRVAFAVFSQ